MLTISPDTSELLFRRPEVVLCENVGSCVTNPDDEHADFDVLIESSDVTATIDALVAIGFSAPSGNTYGEFCGEFVSLRRGHENVLVSGSRSFVTNFLLATAVCKKIGPIDKRSRKCVFQAVLYGHLYSGS